MNWDEKTLVILTPGFPENEADTTCLPMQQSFIRTLKEIYPHLNIIILSFQYPYFKKRYDWFGNTVISFDGRNKGGLTKLLLRLKLVQVLKELHHSNELAGILSFWYGECAWIGKRFAFKNNIKHYCWIMGQDARKENKCPKRIPPKSGELIALSDFLQDEFEKNHGIRPQHVITAGVATKKFNNTTEKKDIEILATGSLIQLKQFDIFLEVVAEIKKQLPQVNAILIGNGPEKERLQILITKLGLETNVSLTGELPYPEVLQLMQRTKVFLHPSLYEGFSGVCLEALYAGAHVISFCRAMKQDIEQWHIVNSKEEMKRETLTLLDNQSTVYKSVRFSVMEDVVRKMMELFP